MNKKLLDKVFQDLWDILICDGGVDHFDDAIRETQKILMKYKIKDPDIRERVWQQVSQNHPFPAEAKPSSKKPHLI